MIDFKAVTKNADRMLRQIAALRKGKNVVWTRENTNPAETNRRVVRVKQDGRAYLDAQKKQAASQANPKKKAGGDE